jgi:hypothetical protein
VGRGSLGVGNLRLNEVRTKTKRLLRWVGALGGVPAIAAVYRAAAARRAERGERQLVVRATVETELVNDLVELVRQVRGRAALNGRDSFSVPVPKGVPEHAAYRELRAVLERWEQNHPGIRAEILSITPSRARTRRMDVETAGVR